MATVCPLCNGLTVLTAPCPRCQEPVEDGGQMEGYDDPYSPYEDDLLVPAPNAGEDPQKWCWHLVYCRQCGWEGNLPVAQREGL
ncbi:MAG: hypothetical protein GX750_00330 [Clostridia bacterium]|nr:hypothetical protein [Clostridia bacterium]